MKARQAKKLLNHLLSATKLVIPPDHLLAIKVVSDDVDQDMIQDVKRAFEQWSGRKVCVFGVSHDDDVQLTAIEYADAPILTACPPPTASAEQLSSPSRTESPT